MNPIQINKLGLSKMVISVPIAISADEKISQPRNQFFFHFFFIVSFRFFLYHLCVLLTKRKAEVERKKDRKKNRKNERKIEKRKRERE